MNKQQQRILLQSRVAELTDSEKANASLVACNKIEMIPEFQKATSILLYSALSDEIPTIPLFLASLELKKKIAFPRAIQKTKELELHWVQNLVELKPGYSGILEPDEKLCPPASIQEFSFVLIPGLGFNRKGVRLGRGAGFYDRFLHQLPQNIYRAGFFFSCQELPEIHKESHDQCLNAIVTEKELIRVSTPS
jgi:5-formyltetrahydrofolate cyclo-ligase